VVARGRGETAQAIKALAKEGAVPMLEYPQVARAIYFTSRAGQTVAEDLYIAVATVLAFVFRLDQALAEGNLPAVSPRARGQEVRTRTADRSPLSKRASCRSWSVKEQRWSRQLSAASVAGRVSTPPSGRGHSPNASRAPKAEMLGKRLAGCPGQDQRVAQARSDLESFASSLTDSSPAVLSHHSGRLGFLVFSRQPPLREPGSGPSGEIVIRPVARAQTLFRAMSWRPPTDRAGEHDLERRRA
jgi:type III secretion system FlhB-like substrate exporter